MNDGMKQAHLLFHFMTDRKSTLVAAAVLAVADVYLLLRRWRNRRARRAATSRPPICLHFDVNETIMLGDPAGGDTFEDSLNKVIAKTAFVKRVPPESRARAGRDFKWSEYVWHDGTPLDPDARREAGLEGSPAPPLLDVFADVPEGCVRFYDVPELKRAYAKTFTSDDSPGYVYRGTLDEMRRAMRWPDGLPRDERLCEKDGHYTILPAFFQVLATLRASRRPFSVVLRTFGSDVPRVIDAIDAFCEGKHPRFPGVLAPELAIPPERTWLGRYSRDDGSFTLVSNPTGADPRNGGGLPRLGAASASAPALAEDAMLAELQGGLGTLPRLSAVQDDYEWWRSHGYEPASGKPLWLTLRDPEGWRHVFFDDNIHAKPHDSIVAVRMRRTPAEAFTPLSVEATMDLHGSVLRKVPTVKAVCDIDWFLREIEACDASIDELCTPMLA